MRYRIEQGEEVEHTAFISARQCDVTRAVARARASGLFLASSKSAWHAAPRVASSRDVRPSASTMPTMAPEEAMAALAAGFPAPIAARARIAGARASSSSL